MNTYLIRLKIPNALQILIPAERVEESEDRVWFIFYNLSGKEVGRYRQEEVSYWYLCGQDPLPPLQPPEMGGAASTGVPTTRQDVLANVESIWDFPSDTTPSSGPGVPFVVRPTYPGGVSPFELIQETGYSGYIYEDVLASLNHAQAQDLAGWMHGQTMALRETPEGIQSIIYAWDYDRWLQGLPVVD